MNITRRKVFTLATVATISACGLVIDPDKLVADNGKADPAEAGAQDVATIDATGGDTGPTKDGGTSVTVPECVPAKTTGEGPYAVVSGKAGTTLSCPTGYLATPVASGKGDFGAGSLTCSASGCTCGSPAGTPACGLRVRYFENSSCTDEKSSPDDIGTTCKDLENENYLRVEYKITGVNCPNTGPSTTTPTSKPTPAYANDYVVCTPDPAVTLALCKGGETPMPPASNASACIVVPSGTPCPFSTYDRTRDLSKTGGFTDTRTCTCGCGAAPSTCTGGSATAFADQACSGSSSAAIVDNCRARNQADSMNGVLPTPSGQTTCSVSSTPTGSASPQYDLRICCIGQGGGD